MTVSTVCSDSCYSSYSCHCIDYRALSEVTVITLVTVVTLVTLVALLPVVILITVLTVVTVIAIFYLTSSKSKVLLL